MINYYSLLAFLCLTFSGLSQNKVCKPTLSVYFDSNANVIHGSNETNLSQFIKNLEQDKSYIIQLMCYTDSIGSFSFNDRLADSRGRSVANFFKSTPLKIESIVITSKGERESTFDNSTEINKQKNRRVDIVLIPVDKGNITLVGPSGTKLTISKDYFSPCSVCEANPRVIEIRNADQAAARGVPLLTTDGMELITGGMVQLEFDCPDLRTDTCFSAIIEFPIDTIATSDSTMGLWESVSTPDGIRWRRVPNKKCEPKLEVLITKIDCFQGSETNSVPPFNCDVLKCKTTIVTPHLLRPFNNSYIKGDTSIIKTVAYCPDSSFIITDIGILSDRTIACYHGSLSRYKKEDKQLAIIPISAYTIFVLPDIKRKKSATRIDYNNGGAFRLTDEGIDTNNIRYYLDKLVSPRHVENVLSDENYDHISLNEYSKTLSFYDSTFVVKSPKSLVSSVQIIIPPIDSVLTVDQYKSKANAYEFELPKHPVNLLINLKRNKQDEKIMVKLDSEMIKKKYKKRRKYYKLKIKKRELKKLLEKSIQ